MPVMGAIIDPAINNIIRPVIALDEFPPTLNPPSGDWIIDDQGNFIVDEDHNFLYG